MKSARRWPVHGGQTIVGARTHKHFAPTHKLVWQRTQFMVARSVRSAQRRVDRQPLQSVRHVMGRQAAASYIGEPVNRRTSKHPRKDFHENRYSTQKRRQL